MSASNKIEQEVGGSFAAANTKFEVTTRNKDIEHD
jgi:hypothetical protein